MTSDELQRLGDEELMPFVGDKLPDAFEIFYDRHGGAAYSLAYRMVGDREVAEDVTQEAFLSIWRSRARYDRARGSVRSWLLGIVRNRAIDALRRMQTKAPRLDFNDDELLEGQPAPERTDTEVARRDEAERVRAVLTRLPNDQSKVIELAFFGGFSHSEIAQALNVPLGTVKGRMRLGMEKMRVELAEGVV